eukprot:scaffold230729_cov26-Tisochrysis_lutea.AAC.5
MSSVSPNESRNAASAWSSSTARLLARPAPAAASSLALVSLSCATVPRAIARPPCITRQPAVARGANCVAWPTSTTAAPESSPSASPKSASKMAWPVGPSSAEKTSSSRTSEGRE